MRHLFPTALVAAVHLLAGSHVGAATVATAHGVCAECHIGGAVAAAGRDHSINDTCTACHADKRSIGQPAHACTACHDHHPNGTTAWLHAPATSPAGPAYDRVTRLCLSCHEAAGRTVGHAGRFVRHPVGITVAFARKDTSLPLFDVRGTARATDDVIGCLTCHTAHQTADTKLRRWNQADEPAACRTCHDLARPPDTMTAFRRR